MEPAAILMNSLSEILRAQTGQLRLFLSQGYSPKAAKHHEE